MHAQISLEPAAFPTAPAPASASAHASAPAHTSAPASVSVPVPATVNAPLGWAAAFLRPDADAPIDLRAEGLRFVTGAGLASLYGLALGARDGGASLIRHALGVPAALFAVAGLGVPALFIALALFNAPLDPPRVAASAARAAASAGLLLAGLAPVAALYVVSSEHTGAAILAGAFGLFLGGLSGVTRLLRELGGSLAGQSELGRLAAGCAFAAFAVFATALAARVWFATLPLFGGAS